MSLFLDGASDSDPSLIKKPFMSEKILAPLNMNEVPGEV